MNQAHTGQHLIVLVNQNKLVTHTNSTSGHTQRQISTLVKKKRGKSLETDRAQYLPGAPCISTKQLCLPLPSLTNNLHAAIGIDLEELQGENVIKI